VGIADFDADGRLDVAAATARGLLVLLGLPDGSLTAPLLFGTATAAGGLGIADLNGDAQPDVVLLQSSSNAVSVFLNTTGIELQQPARFDSQSQVFLAVPLESESGIVRLRWRLPATVQSARLDVFDVRGRRLWWTLPEKGEGTCDWDRHDGSGSRLARGVYFVRLVAGDARRTRKLVLLRD
jgi:hypothetical protein